MKHWFVICVKHCCLCEASPKINGISNFQDWLFADYQQKLVWPSPTCVSVFLLSNMSLSLYIACAYTASNVYLSISISWVLLLDFQLSLPKNCVIFHGQPPLSFVQCKTPHQCITVVQNMLHWGIAVFLICTYKCSAVYLYLMAGARASSGQGLLTSTTCCVIFIVSISLLT